ncbi:BnaC09g08890D [Brassica napus]|uniref:3-ketoacyl-CoA synthase n=4 Tax=Brassica TaxID=3705 RepID=A0A078GNJ4_BRANA|nr:unnamed protein product [Brassica napus]CDY26762.1 BnaC09g08890D [Brassica napus]VDD28860.1 unnamed protein product [Brassica oleracea]
MEAAEPVNGGSVQIQNENTSRKLPNFLQSVNMKYVKLGYHHLIKQLFKLCLVPLMAVVISEISRLTQDDFHKLWLHLQYNLVSFILLSALAVFGCTVFVMTGPRSVYLVDYSCYLPPESLRVPYKNFMDHSKVIEDFNESSLEFQRGRFSRDRVWEKRRISLRVCTASLHAPPWWPRVRKQSSLFNPTPSLSVMIVNKYKLRGNVKSFNLGGMGCSAGVISIDLAKDMLQVHRKTYAVVVSTENITQNWYFGNKKAMLIPNCLFRVGGTAVLLSNKASDRRRSKYMMVHTVRTHKGANEKAFNCVYQEQDDNGKTGVSLSKDLMAIAGEALKANITTLGPLVLPISEHILFFATLVAKKLFNAKMKPYIPDFKLAFDHFCIHAGGRAMIDELEKNLELSLTHVEASGMTLHRFGNTSSSSIWIKKGDRVWQIAFGSGFKCNRAVLVALDDVKPSVSSPWEHCIDRYPVKLDY